MSLFDRVVLVEMTDDESLRISKKLSGNQRDALLEIYKGVSTTADLSRALRTSAGAALHLARALEKKGLVEVTTGWDYKGSVEVTFQTSDHGSDVGEGIEKRQIAGDNMIKAIKAKHAARRAAKKKKK